MSLAVILASLLALAVLWRLARFALRLAVAGALLVALAAYGIHLGGEAPHATPPRAPPPSSGGRVIGVADGDTVTVRTAHGPVRVRLLGIDAPEASTLRFGHRDCGGRAATRALRRLARPGGHGVRVRLRTDPASGDVRDAYGRTLAYLDGPDGDLAAAQLRAGHAVVYRYHGRRFSRLEPYRRAQAAARAQRRGAWAACHGRFHAPRRANPQL